MDECPLGAFLMRLNDKTRPGRFFGGLFSPHSNKTEPVLSCVVRNIRIAEMQSNSD